MTNGERAARIERQRGGRMRHDKDGMTYACPECDRGGNVYLRVADPDPRGETADKYDCRCEVCGAMFDVQVAVWWAGRRPVGSSRTGARGDGP